MTVQNTSSSNSEDIWLTFPNATALSALNTLGTYGAVQILVDGNQVYENNNLNDIPNNGTSGLPAGRAGRLERGPDREPYHVTFKFEYASLMSKQEPGGVFNQYPITLAMTGKVLRILRLCDRVWSGHRSLDRRQRQRPRRSRSWRPSLA